MTNIYNLLKEVSRKVSYEAKLQNLICQRISYRGELDIQGIAASLKNM
jgi:hypothetical protein